jgi:hypothetical protein
MTRLASCFEKSSVVWKTSWRKAREGTGRAERRSQMKNARYKEKTGK